MGLFEPVAVGPAAAEALDEFGVAGFEFVAGFESVPESGVAAELDDGGLGSAEPDDDALDDGGLAGVEVAGAGVDDDPVAGELELAGAGAGCKARAAEVDLDVAGWLGGGVVRWQLIAVALAGVTCASWVALPLAAVEAVAVALLAGVALTVAVLVALGLPVALAVPLAVAVPPVAGLLLELPAAGLVAGPAGVTAGVTDLADFAEADGGDVDGHVTDLALWWPRAVAPWEEPPPVAPCGLAELAVPVGPPVWLVVPKTCWPSPTSVSRSGGSAMAMPMAKTAQAIATTGLSRPSRQFLRGRRTLPRSSPPD